MLIARKSIITGIIRTKDLDITQDQIDAYEIGGSLLQDAFPHLSPEDREFFKTGIDAEEWQKYIATPEVDIDDVLLEGEDILGVIAAKPEQDKLADNDGVPIKVEPTYHPPSKKIYSTKNFRADRLRQLRPILKYLTPEIILAGGSLRTVLNCGNEEVSDFDLFFTTFEHVGDLIVALKKDDWKEIFACPEELLFTYKKGKHKLQLICETEYPDAPSLLKVFDVSACCSALHNGVIYGTREFVRGVYTKKLRINNVTFPVATIKRLVKYHNKGYCLSQAAEDFMHLVNNKNFTSDQFRQYLD